MRNEEVGPTDLPTEGGDGDGAGGASWERGAAVPREALLSADSRDEHRHFRGVTMEADSASELPLPLGFPFLHKAM